MFGSAAISAHGRYALSPELTLFGGATLGKYDQKGADVSLNVGGAVALQFDPTGFGASRPYASASFSASYQNTSYKRTYTATDQTLFGGSSSTTGYSVSAALQAGWVDRMSRRDELAASVAISRQWQTTGGYAEPSATTNPFNATVPKATDRLDLASFNVQYTRLVTRSIEVNINGGANWAFNSHSGLQPIIAGGQVSIPQTNFVYYQAGGRIGLRTKLGLVIDLFADRIMAPGRIGSSTHGGLGARWTF